MARKKLGSILKDKGYVNENELETALGIQEDVRRFLLPPPKVGQLLEAIVPLSKDQVAEGLKEQAEEEACPSEEPNSPKE